MKKMLALLLVTALAMSSSLVFADNSHEITSEELTELSQQYDFVPTIVKENVSGVDVKKGLTKGQLESLIKKMKKENEKPLHFTERSIPETGLSIKDVDNNQMSFVAAASGWTVINKAKNLYVVSNHMGISDFKLQKSVLAMYQYESMKLPGEPEKTQNWKFTGTDRGTVTHLNPGAYMIKSVTSSATYSSSTITQNFNGVVNVGFYTNVAGVTVRIPIGDNTFSGTQTYSISLCK